MSELLYDNRIVGLIIKYLQGEITVTDQAELQAWVNSSDRSKEIFEELTSVESLNEELKRFIESRELILKKIRAAGVEIPDKGIKKLKWWKRLKF